MEAPFVEMQINNRTVRGVVDVNGNLWLLLFDILCAFAICRRVEQKQMAIYDQEPKVHLDQLPIPLTYELPWAGAEYVVQDCNLPRTLERFRSREVNDYEYVYSLYRIRDCPICLLGAVEDQTDEAIKRWGKQLGIDVFNATKRQYSYVSTSPVRPARLDFWQNYDRKLSLSSYRRDFKHFCRADVSTRDQLRLRRKFVPNFYHQDCTSQPNERHISLMKKLHQNIFACYPFDYEL